MQISVIMPVLNEEERIGQAIERVRRCGACELIVVDGGSRDQTVERAAGCDLLLQTEPGRGRQMNAGAQQAAGEVLLFLHADCWLEPGAWQQMRAASNHPKTVGGGFRQRIEHPAWQYRLLEMGNAWRARQLGWIYGDQGLFVRRDIFTALGGFPEVPLLEDLYFSKRLRQKGTVTLLPGPLHVDPRHWERRGVIRQTFYNWGLIVRAHCGVPLDCLTNEGRDA